MKGYIGRTAFRNFTRKRNPIDPLASSQLELMTIILADRRSAESILAYAKGDLRNLNGTDLKDIASLPGVGEAAAAKVAAMFSLFRQLLNRQSQPSTSTG
ncbi:MAG: hypothetical protein N2318_03285 [Meiothermus sp.]|nr:hypothetical protein [Meiothermus sp.]